VQDDYISHLSKDKVLGQILEGATPRQLKHKTDIPLYLYTSIINQQLSTRVGQVLLERFLNLFDGIAPTPGQVIALPFEKLQAIGLSKSKTAYIRNVAQYAIEPGLEFEKVNAMTDDEVMAYVTAIKGIGKWSAQNLLLSALGREDVFSGDDLIIQNAMAALYSLDKFNKKEFRKEIERLAEAWSPYRTYACVHLWQWNPKKIEQTK